MLDRVKDVGKMVRLRNGTVFKDICYSHCSDVNGDLWEGTVVSGPTISQAMGRATRSSHDLVRRVWASRRGERKRFEAKRVQEIVPSRAEASAIREDKP